MLPITPGWHLDGAATQGIVTANGLAQEMQRRKKGGTNEALSAHASSWCLGFISSDLHIYSLPHIPPLHAHAA